MPGIDGWTLREWRRGRGWDVPQLARQLRHVSKEPVAAHDGLVRMIRSWERGTHALSERYELLYRSLGLGRAGGPDSPAGTPAAALADAVTVSSAAPPLPRLRLGDDPDARPAERFLLARRALRDNDNLFGPRDVIPLAMRQLALLRELSRTSRGGDRRELLLPQVQFADLLGWLYQDCREFDTARHWLDRALEWAHMLDDQACVAFVLARKSQLACDTRDPDTAIAAADAAMRIAGERELVGAVAATYAAHGYALSGDAATAERLYDEARAMLGTTDATGTVPWVTFLDDAYIDVYRAGSLAALGQHAAAAAGFRAAISGLRPVFHRDRGVYLAREARARASAGEHDHAAELAMRALAIGMETRSARVFAELADVRDATAPASDSPAVSGFRAALTATAAS